MRAVAVARCRVAAAAGADALRVCVTLPTLAQVLAKRADLKVVVMSATLEAEKFQGYFTDAPLMARATRRRAVHTARH